MSNMAFVNKVTEITSIYDISMDESLKAKKFVPTPATAVK